MSDCGVCIGGFDGYSEFFSEEVRRARKTYKCSECDREIVPGQKYVVLSGKCEGDLWRERCCEVCNEISKAFSCDGRSVGNLWEEMDYVMDELTTTCFDRLTTPEAKAYLRQRWMEHKELI